MAVPVDTLETAVEAGPVLEMAVVVLVAVLVAGVVVPTMGVHLTAVPGVAGEWISLVKVLQGAVVLIMAAVAAVALEGLMVATKAIQVKAVMVVGMAVAVALVIMDLGLVGAEVGRGAL